MRAMLLTLKTDGEITVGKVAKLFRYSDGTIGLRMTNSLTAPSQKCTLAGLKRLLDWLDDAARENQYPAAFSIAPRAYSGPAGNTYKFNADGVSR